MVQTYLKIVWRSLWKNKGYTFSNVAGLAIGMASTIMILLWVNDELSWDKFHPNYKNVYQVMVNRDFNGKITTEGSIPYPLVPALKENFAEITAGTVDNNGSDIVLKYKEKIIKNRGISASRDYVNVFQWQAVKGSLNDALAKPENIVLTEAVAKALFGNEEAVGKIIRTNNDVDRLVSAVVQDPPGNSSIQFGALIPFNPNDTYLKQAASDWINSFHQGFVEVRSGTDIEALNRKITAFVQARAENNAQFFLHPMSKWRLYSDFENGVNTGGMIDYVKLFTIIAIIILLIACVNFMNLSTARSEKRAKEVGIRKTLGSERKHLLLQFYCESAFFSLVAYVIAVCGVFLLLPSFSSFIGRPIYFDIMDPLFLIVSFIMVLITAVVAGSYPALYLSSFNPVKVLKGTFLPGKQAALPRKVLVVLQFGISVLLISSTILVNQQIQHVKTRDLGYNPDNLITIPSSPDANKNAEVIRNELFNTNLIESVSRTSSPITEIWNYTPAPQWKGKPQNMDLIMSAMASDPDFAKTTGAKILAGRDLMNVPADSTAMLLNKAAVEAMGLKDPIGTDMRYGNTTYQVVGVTDNLVMASPYAPVMPMMIMRNKRGGAFFMIRLKDDVNPRTALPLIEKIFKQNNPEYPFEYSFVDQQFEKKFITEDLIARLTNIFSMLAIFICCLGLAGLSSYTIEKRFKEIGIRKVLGASVQQLLYLLSKEFLFLVLIAALISVPVTWWLLNNWLENYEYRVQISVWLFAASCAGILLLTLVVVWLNALRAATTNPVKSLRTE